ncbi:hypothetical protein M0802_001750 [Mischocyttarus mexicanus]|nr:hypothetical protein M0802_001750 [Mischocyttarus mexicanus]
MGRGVGRLFFLAINFLRNERIRCDPVLNDYHNDEDDDDAAAAAAAAAATPVVAVAVAVADAVCKSKCKTLDVL